MLDLKYVRENLDSVAAGLNRRAPGTFDPAAFKDIDSQRRAAITEAEGLKAQKNALSKQIGELKKAKQDAAALMEQVKGLDAKMDESASWAEQLDAKLKGILERTPNLPDASVPDGADAEGNVKAQRMLPNDIGAMVRAGGQLIVGLADGQAVALDLK